MVILSLNCGSSSVKYMLYDWSGRKVLASGIVERVAVGGSVITHEVPGRDKFTLKQDCPNHKTAIQLLLDIVSHPQHGVIRDFGEISAVGHRVVHGGEKFVKSVIVTDEILEAFRKLSDLAPLHNPPNISGIEAARELMRDVPHMAIMDTAWHQTMPKSSFLYALPYAWYEKYGIRRYGFHGTSFLYVAKRAAVLLGKDPFQCNLVIAHIGNGVSMNAVRRGVSYDTSMGFTPLEGLVMGTRSGDHDPAVPLYVMWKEGLGPKEMDSVLNKKSGILGITGQFSDRRDVIAAADKGDQRCRLALELESYRIRKYVGAYAAAVGGIDAVVFTAGVGEKCPLIRGLALEGLEYMGIALDPGKNELAVTRNAECEISAPDSAVKVLVIPTDEERVFVEDVAALTEGRYDVHTNFKYRFQDPGFRNTMRDDAFARECAREPRLRGVVCRPPELARV